MVQFANLDREFGWPEGIIASLIQQESGGRGNAVSPVGARGFAQFMPATRQHMIDRYNLDPWSNDINVAARCAALYLNEQHDAFGGDIRKALAAYNAGPGNVRTAVRNGGENWLGQLRQETRNYVPQIMGRLGNNRDFYEAASSYGNESRTAADDAYRAEMNRGRLGALGVRSLSDPATGESTPVEEMGIAQLLGLAVLAIFAQAAQQAPTVQPDARPLRVQPPEINAGDTATSPASASSIADPVAAAIANARPTTPVTSAPADRGASLPSPTTPPRVASAAPQRSGVPA